MSSRSGRAGGLGEPVSIGSARGPDLVHWQNKATELTVFLLNLEFLTDIANPERSFFLLRVWIVAGNLDALVCLWLFRPSILPNPGMSFLYQALEPALIGGIVRDLLNEMAGYKREMTQTHWAILATCVVIFGFMCLKGSGIRR